MIENLIVERVTEDSTLLIEVADLMRDRGVSSVLFNTTVMVNSSKTTTSEITEQRKY